MAMRRFITDWVKFYGNMAMHTKRFSLLLVAFTTFVSEEVGFLNATDVWNTKAGL